MGRTISRGPDNDAAVQRLLRDGRLAFKRLVGQAICGGVTPSDVPLASLMPAFTMGEPLVPIDKALRLAAEFEDLELVHRLREGT